MVVKKLSSKNRQLILVLIESGRSSGKGVFYAFETKDIKLLIALNIFFSFESITITSLSTVLQKKCLQTDPRNV